MTTTDTLPNELRVRPPTMNDLETVTDLIIACDIAEYGEPDYTTDDLRVNWQSPGFNLKTDAWVVVTCEGQVVGYAQVWVWSTEKVRYNATACVHPEYGDQGIGTYLVRLAERGAREQVSQAPPGTQVTLTNTISSVNKAARRILEQQGFTPVRHFWRMQIEMDDAPPKAEWPGRLNVRTFVPGQDNRVVFEAMEEAFQDHWGYTPGVFEIWERRMIRRPDFDPTVWFLAMDGDEIAGAALCHNYSNEGWVRQLGVRRPWRGNGLGLALLHHSFAAFYRRGKRRVALGVDSQNTTGATRLYERAGMQVVRQGDSYQKELRPARDPSNRLVSAMSEH